MKKKIVLAFLLLCSTAVADRPLCDSEGMELMPQARGEQMGNAVLTEALVRRIKKLRHDYLFGAMSITRLLSEDGVVVSPHTVQDVIDGTTWRHVT